MNKDRQKQVRQKCILCSERTRKIHQPQFGDYYCCSNCELISKDEDHIISQTDELEIYNNHQNSIEDPKYVEYFYRFLNDAVFPYTTSGKQGLDFGSGPSPVLAQILSRNHDYQMDIYDLFYAPERVYEGQKYDLVTSTEVVEHLENPIEYFGLFSKLLKPDGILAIMTSFHQNDDLAFLDWHYIRDRSHISFYTPRTMEFIATKVGLKIIYTDSIQYTTFVLDK